MKNPSLILITRSHLPRWSELPRLLAGLVVSLTQRLPFLQPCTQVFMETRLAQTLLQFTAPTAIAMIGTHSLSGATTNVITKTGNPNPFTIVSGDTFTWSWNYSSTSGNKPTAYTVTGMPTGVSYFWATATTSFIKNSTTPPIAITPGTYTLSIKGWENSNATGASTPAYSLSFIVQSALSPTRSSPTASAGSSSISVSSNVAWTASSNQTWAVVSPTSGTTTGTVTVTYTANTSTSPRTATLTIKGQTYTLTQAGAVATTTIPATASAAATANATASIAVTSNTSWTAASNQTWTVVSPTSGSGNASVTVTCSANTSTSPRSATITIGGQTCTLTQAGAVATTTIPATASAAATANATASIAVTSNTSWTAASNQTWAVVSPTSGSGNASVTVTCSANTSASPRSATITIGGQTCTVTQAASPYAAWSVALSAPSFASDSNQNGVANGIEYALGRSASNTPSTAVFSQLPSYTAIAGNAVNNRKLVMTLNLPATPPSDVTYTIQASTDLITWVNIAEKISSGAWTILNNSGAQITSAPPSNGSILNQITGTVAQKYMRLQVSKNP